MRFLLAIIGTALAIIDQQHLTLKPDDVYINYLRFSFLDGGDIETNFDVSTTVNTDLGFYLCQPSQIKHLEKTFDDTDFCNKYDSARFRGCDYGARVPAKVDEMSYLANKTNFTFEMYMENYGVNPEYLNETMLESYEEAYINYTTQITTIGSDEIEVDVNKTTTYYFILTNCANATVKVKVDYVVMNPNGEHLSVGYLELKDVMLAAKIAWGLIFLAWVCSWLIARKRPKLVQIVLTLDAAIWTVYSFVEHDYWLKFSEDGYPDHMLERISFGLLSLAEALFFSAMILLACGVGIVHRLHFWILASSALCFILVIGARGLLYIKGEKVLYGFAGLYMGFLVLLLFLICLSIRKLHKQMILISSVDIDPVGTSIWQRLRMFRIWRVTLIILMPLLCVSYIFTIKFLVFYPWIAAAEHISIVLLTYFILFLYMRFKRHDMYFDKVVFKINDDIPEFTLKDIKQRTLPIEMYDPFSVRFT